MFVWFVFHAFEIFLVVLRTRTTVGAVMARKFKNVSAFTTVSVVYSCDSLFLSKVRQGCRVVVRNIAGHVPMESMPRNIDLDNSAWSSDSRERAVASSSSRSHVRERSRRWFVFCVCEFCHFKVLTSWYFLHHHGVVVTVNSGQRSCVIPSFT